MKLFITGMHRSGTSLLTRILLDYGFYLGGDDDFHDPDKLDPNGYWEHKDFLLVNELLLKESGASWNQPDKFSIDKLSKVRLNEIKVLADKAIGKMDYHANWVVKDPRMCLTLGFWKEIIPDLCVVAMHRDPLQVAQSLQNRDAFPIQYSVGIWEYYTKALIANAHTCNFSYVLHHKLLSDPEKTLAELRNTLADWGYEETTTDLANTELAKKANKIIDKNLFRATADGFDRSHYLTLEQQNLNLAIFEKSHLSYKLTSPSPQVANLVSCLGSMIDRYQNDVIALNNVIEQRTHEKRDINQYVDSLKENLAQKDQNIQSLTQHIDDREKRIKEIAILLKTQELKIEEIARYSKTLRSESKEAVKYSTSLESEDKLRLKHIDALNVQITEMSTLMQHRESELDEAKTYIMTIQREEENTNKYIDSLSAESLKKANYTISLEAELTTVTEYAQSLKKHLEESLKESQSTGLLRDELVKVTTYAKSLESHIQETLKAAEYTKSLKSELEKVTEYAKLLEGHLQVDKPQGSPSID
jgi:hypothetical protein